MAPISSSQFALTEALRLNSPAGFWHSGAMSIFSPELVRNAVFLAALSALAACTTAPPRPLERLDSTDRQIRSEATQAALENSPLGEARNWTNPASGHRGTVTPTRTYAEESERPCRDYQTTVTVEGETETSLYRACREADGQWVEVPRPNRYARKGHLHPYGPYHRYPHYRYPYYGYYGFGHRHYHSGFHFSLGTGFAI